jgi:hypothetical protein
MAHSQCREWLVEVLVTYCGSGLSFAIERADMFEGFGPTIYTKTHQASSTWLGADD